MKQYRVGGTVRLCTRAENLYVDWPVKVERLKDLDFVKDTEVYESGIVTFRIQPPDLMQFNVGAPVQLNLDGNYECQNHIDGLRQAHDRESVAHLVKIAHESTSQFLNQYLRMDVLLDIPALTQRELPKPTEGGGFPPIVDEITGITTLQVVLKMNKFGSASAFVVTEQNEFYIGEWSPGDSRLALARMFDDEYASPDPLGCQSSHRTLTTAELDDYSWWRNHQTRALSCWLNIHEGMCPICWYKMLGIMEQPLETASSVTETTGGGWKAWGSKPPRDISTTSTPSTHSSGTSTTQIFTPRKVTFEKSPPERYPGDTGRQVDDFKLAVDKINRAMATGQPFKKIPKPHFMTPEAWEFFLGLFSKHGVSLAFDKNVYTITVTQKSLFDMSGEDSRFLEALGKLQGFEVRVVDH